MGDGGDFKNGYRRVGGEWLGKIVEWRRGWVWRICVVLVFFFGVFCFIFYR